MIKRTLSAITLAFAILVAGAIPKTGHALIGDQLGLSPFWDWKTLETDHFRVSFPAELEDSAQKVANYLEEAHSLLSPRLYWTPLHKVQVLAIDNADLANGLTSAVARVGMVFYLTPPDPYFSTAYYDDWLRLLVLHEYTHFLNMDATEDFYEVLRFLTGDILLPNSLWPTWMLEGLAVYMETRFTQRGRGRSPYYEMILRTAVDENVLNESSFITLDKINGDNPNHPAGETPYLFGYQLMNQIARTNEDTLGLMSKRSAGRIPYFINGNLDNLTGKDWYDFWKEWVKDTRERESAALAKIRTQPVTQVEHLTPSESVTVLGPTPSPDGQWLAFTNETPDRRSGLYLLKLTDQERKAPVRVDDKIEGGGAAFTPDSKFLLYSSVHRRHQYYLWSDLAVYDLEADSTYFISDGLRARDPDVSRDGKWVVFTISENATTTLAIAPLIRSAQGRLSLGEVRKIPAALKYDRVSIPKFSLDGRRILYSIHRIGMTSEELMAWSLELNRAETLVSDGHFNRYPAVNAAGEVYFISDATGVNNLYRLEGMRPELKTNVTTGLAFPAFGKNDALFAATYASSGWSIARVSLAPQPIHPIDVTIAPAPAPPLDTSSENHANTKHYPVDNYSIFPSIWPRQWLLLPVLYQDHASLQAEVAGFDAVDRHAYVLGLGYNTAIPKLDWTAVYSNRAFGPTLTFVGSNRSTGLSLNQESYARSDEYSILASFPILATYSTIVPTLALNSERTFDHLKGANPADGDVIGKSTYVPSADFSMLFTNAESSRLSISAERGRSTVIGARIYSDSGNPIWKGVLKDNEYIPITDHTVLNPSVKALWTSAFNDRFAPANAVVEGYDGTFLASPFTSVFGAVALRGYPHRIIYSRAVAIGALDLKFPILRIFRGWGTHPLFLENLYGFAFAEAGYFPASRSGISVLPSAGGGLRLTTDLLLRIPLTLSVEYHQGFRTQVGGKPDLFLQLGLGTLQF